MRLACAIREACRGLVTRTGSRSRRDRPGDGDATAEPSGRTSREYTASGMVMWPRASSGGPRRPDPATAAVGAAAPGSITVPSAPSPSKERPKGSM